MGFYCGVSVVVSPTTSQYQTAMTPTLFSWLCDTPITFPGPSVVKNLQTFADMTSHDSCPDLNNLQRASIGMSAILPAPV